MARKGEGRIIKSFGIPISKGETYRTFEKGAEREGYSVSELLTEMIDKWVLEHGESNNPQTILGQFESESVMAVPNVYEAGKSNKWEQFYNLVQTLDDYKILDVALNEVLRLHEKKWKSLK